MKDKSSTRKLQQSLSDDIHDMLRPHKERDVSRAEVTSALLAASWTMDRVRGVALLSFSQSSPLSCVALIEGSEPTSSILFGTCLGSDGFDDFLSLSFSEDIEDFDDTRRTYFGADAIKIKKRFTPKLHLALKMTKRVLDEERIITSLNTKSRRKELIDHLKILKLDNPFELPSFQDVASVFGLGGLPRVCEEKVSFGKGGMICLGVYSAS